MADCEHCLGGFFNGTVATGETVINGVVTGETATGDVVTDAKQSLTASSY